MSSPTAPVRNAEKSSLDTGTRRIREILAGKSRLGNIQ